MADSDGEEDNLEKALKVVLLGDSNCGKTALCHRFSQHSFPLKYTQTIGVDFYSRRITLKTNISSLLQIWDVGGHNISSTRMLNTYIYGAHAVLFVYDVTNTQSFENLTDWIQLAKKVSRNLEKPFHMALVGNKTDMEHRRVVRIERHNKAAEQHALEPSYVSAKTGDSVELMFKTVAAKVLGLQLSKAEKEWNISVIQAQIPANEAKSPINKSGGNLPLVTQQKTVQDSSPAKPSSASTALKTSAQPPLPASNNKNSAVCCVQ